MKKLLYTNHPLGQQVRCSQVTQSLDKGYVSKSTQQNSNLSHSIIINLVNSNLDDLCLIICH